MKFCKLALVASALVLTTSVNAALVQYNFGGTITDSGGNGPSAPLGTTFAGTLSYDDALTPSSTFANGAFYSAATVEIAFVGGVLNETNVRLAVQDDTSFAFGDQFQLAVGANVEIPATSTYNGASINLLQIVFEDPGKTALSGVGLPGALSLSDFNALVTLQTAGSFTSHGEITSLSTSAVPIPAAVWLFGSGLLGLIGIARRKKAA